MKRSRTPVLASLICIAFVSVIVAATYYSDTGQSRTWNISVDPGTHTFVVNGIGSYRETDWYVSGSFIRTDISQLSNGYWDPTLNKNFTSGFVKIEGKVYNSTGTLLETHTWNVTVNQPDLIAQSVTVSDTTVDPGQSITVNWTAKNQGNGSAGSSQQGVMWSTDSTISRTDTLLEREFLGSMSPGATSPESHVVTIPANATPGQTYYIGVYADYDLAVGESNEDNGSLAVAVIVNQPDLIAQSVTVSDTTVDPGQSITVNWTAKNQGNGSAGSSQQGVMWSTDSTISRSDTLLEREFLGSMNPGATSPEAHTITIPANATPGQTYYIGVYVDYDLAVSESSESNNGSSAVVVTVNAPDLIAQSVTVSDTTVDPGQSITVNWTAKNQGNGSAGSSQQGVMWSTDSTISRSDTLLEREFLGSMNPGATSPEAHTITIPANATPGQTYYIGVYADYDLAVSEGNEGNNNSTPVAVTVNAPDLITYNVSVSDSTVNPGQNITVTWTARNQGAGSSESSQQGVMWSTDSSISRDDTLLDREFLGTMSAGVTSPESHVVSIPANAIPGQTYYIGVYADYDLAVSESNEDNGSLAVAVTVNAVSAAEIVSFDVPTGTRLHGDSVTISATVKNTGTTTRSFWVGLSIAAPFAGAWESRAGWLDVVPKETGVLAPDQNVLISWTFTVENHLPISAASPYRAYIAVWDGYDPTRTTEEGQMLEPIYDRRDDIEGFKVIDSEGSDDPFSLAAYDSTGIFNQIPRYAKSGGELVNLQNLANGVLKESSGRVLDSTDTKLLVLIHGWNPLGAETAYSTTEWMTLTGNLTASGGIPVDWTLVKYDWMADAATLVPHRVPATQEAARTAALSIDPRLVYLSAKEAGGYSASRAARKSFQHGLMLAKKVGEQVGYDNVSEIQIISHSAGSWAALALAQALSSRCSGTTQIQVVYLDPFIPAKLITPWILQIAGEGLTAFDEAQLASVSSHARVTVHEAVKAQAYYSALDVIDFYTQPTTVGWAWSFPSQGLVKQTDSLFELFSWSGHSGPIQYFGESIDNPLDARFGEGGWKYSLAYNDTPPATILTDKGTMTVLEGGTATLQVKLSAQPPGNVTVSVSRDSGDSDISVQSGASLTFTTSNWNSYQPVTLAAAEDGDTSNGSAVIRCSASGLANIDVTATEQDNDLLAIVTDNDTVAVPEGSTATFQVRLNAQPPGNVNVSVSRNSGDSDISVQSGASLTFTTSNWNSYQPVTLAAAEDGDTSNGSATLRCSANDLANKDVTAMEQDNDVLAIVTDKDTVTVSEGSLATFQVKLNAQPPGNVTVSVSRNSGDSDISVQSGASLTFTTSSWNTYQTVTLAAAEDGDTRDGSAVIRCNASAFANKDVTATEQDNDSEVVLNPANGHYYEFVSTTKTWSQAKTDAESRIHNGWPGHLVTIQDQAENDFVKNLVLAGTVWIGGYQPPGSPEPAGGFRWVTEEPFSFVNWAPGEPNQFEGSNEDSVVLNGANYQNPGKWQDAPGTTAIEYIVEYEPPLAVLNPASGHYYLYVPSLVTWPQAKAAAETLVAANGWPGHLVTITSAAENNFVLSLVPAAIEVFAGGFQPEGSPEPAGNWQWVTGEPFDYAHWVGVEPNNSNGEDFLAFRGRDTATPGEWNDVGNVALAYVVEFELPLAPGALQFDAASYSVSENAGNVALTVNRTGGSDGTVTVNYATANGTAAAGSDYTATTGTLTFANRETSKTISVPLTDDTIYEGDEAFTVTLSNPGGGASLGTQVATTVTIADNEPPLARIVRVVNVSGASGGSIVVPVELAAQGDENALGFTLTFDPAILTYSSAALGPDAPTGTPSPILNTAQTDSGKLGVLFGLSPGTSFTAGAKHFLNVTFTAASVGQNTDTVVGFGDQPVTREITDAAANTLTATWQSGTVSLTVGYEADVAPRPNGSNNGTVTTADWVQTGRFAAGLDTPAVGSEYQRADCAPKATLGGGGPITAADWVQAGRYAAGLDPAVAAGGPTAPGGGAARVAASVVGARLVWLTEGRGLSGSTVEVLVCVDASGTENSLGFSVQFDAASLTFVEVLRGADTSGGQLIVNDTQAASGKVGVLVGLNIGETLAAGRRQLAKLRFTVGGTGSQRFAVSFTDTPVTRELTDSAANTLSATFRNGAVAVSTSLIDPPSPQVIADLLTEGYRLNVQTIAGKTYRVEWSEDFQTWTLLTTFTSNGQAAEFLDEAARQRSQRFYRVIEVNP